MARVEVSHVFELLVALAWVCTDSLISLHLSPFSPDLHVFCFWDAAHNARTQCQNPHVASVSGIVRHALSEIPLRSLSLFLGKG